MNTTVNFHLKKDLPVEVDMRSGKPNGNEYHCISISQDCSDAIFFCTPEQALAIGEAITAYATAIIEARK